MCVKFNFKQQKTEYKQLLTYKNPYGIRHKKIFSRRESLDADAMTFARNIFCRKHRTALQSGYFSSYSVLFLHHHLCLLNEHEVDGSVN